jgi:rSAM/selenodomain-associated transferase 1
MSAVTVIVMAKHPRTGSAKSRLRAAGYTAAAAERLAWAMLRCTVARVAHLGAVLVAVTPDGSAQSVLDEIDLPNVGGLDQGAGDLGMRLERAWSQTSKAPVVFFGTDSPDVPEAHLDEIPRALRRADVAVGPTTDGGYWALAAAAHDPRVLRGIDWGSRRVYHQTCLRAACSDLKLQPLPAWHDVDRPCDVVALRHRIDAALGNGDESAQSRGHLRMLAETIDALGRASRPATRAMPP